jgi:hypothetical protein
MIQTGRRPEINLLMRAAVVIFWMTVVSMCAVSGVLARFTSEANAGDSASAAAFEITGSTDIETASFVVSPGSGEGGAEEDQIFTIKIKNSSEVSVKYHFSIEMEGNLPLSIAAVDTDSVEQDEDGEWYTKSPAASGSTVTYQFYPVWDSAKNSYVYSEGAASISITATAEQED